MKIYLIKPEDKDTIRKYLLNLKVLGTKPKILVANNLSCRLNKTTSLLKKFNSSEPYDL